MSTIIISLVSVAVALAIGIAIGMVTTSGYDVETMVWPIQTLVRAVQTLAREIHPPVWEIQPETWAIWDAFLPAASMLFKVLFFIGLFIVVIKILRAIAGTLSRSGDVDEPDRKPDLVDLEKQRKKELLESLTFEPASLIAGTVSRSGDVDEPDYTAASSTIIKWVLIWVLMGLVALVVVFTIVAIFVFAASGCDMQTLVRAVQIGVREIQPEAWAMFWAMLGADLPISLIFFVGFFILVVLVALPGGESRGGYDYDYDEPDRKPDLLDAVWKGANEGLESFFPSSWRS